MLEDKRKIIVSTGNILNVNKKAGQKTHEELLDCLNVTVSDPVIDTDAAIVTRNGDDLLAKVTEYERNDIKIGAKVFLNHPNPNLLREAIDSLLEILKIDCLDNLILAYHPLDVSTAKTNGTEKSNGYGIAFEEQVATSSYEDLIKPAYLPLEEYPIQMTDEGLLRWPAVFCYPEFEICDFQQQIYDSNTVYDILCDLFAERMPQDKNYKYKPDTVNVYFENRIKASIHRVDVQKTIKEITTDKNFLVGRGVLTFHVVTKGTDAEKRFLTKERTRLNITKF